MNQRSRYIIGAVGILYLAAGFALEPAPVQSILLGAGISTIHQTTFSNELVVAQASRTCCGKKNGGKK
jgi:hypothetical protein